MNTACFNLTISLIIKTTGPLCVISDIMRESPTKTILDSASGFDIWVKHKRYKDRSDIGECIQLFFDENPELRCRINDVRECGLCTLRLSFVSVYGQFGFSFSRDDLRLLHELAIPFEITIFSYGGCDDK